jgi:8-oxo-dGTP diphosphatase
MVRELPARAAAKLAVSTVIFALRADEASSHPVLWIPLVRRIRDPFRNQWALPGGWLPADEQLSAAASRTLAETTGLRPKYLEQLYTFGDIDRSPAGRVVSVVYWALVQSDEAERASVDENTRWFLADHLPDLAFDHNRIIEYALWRLRTKLEYSRIAHAFLGETFTLAQLREVHEAVLQRPLDPANFRRMIEGSGTLVDTGRRLIGTPHRPPKLYRYEAVDLDGPGPDGRPLPHDSAGRPAAHKPDPIVPHPRMRT